MPNDASPTPHSPYVGRGAAMRFAGLADLGVLPETAPGPPAWTAVASPPSKAEGELPFLTVAQAACLIRERRLSPVELTQALLARIERLNPVLNAYITVTADLALEQAREAEQAISRGDYLGPLHGIPISLKDLIGTAGVLTTGGTGALADWIPAEDATVWRKLREAGAILLGKTGLHEMAAGFTNLNPFYGATRNPWDPSRITGGSSGGSGAAVAGHLCLASIGSDTAGSIRVPSALCGIVGLKPTFGRVSTQGALYLSWTNDHLGPMAKTVEDAALLLNVVAGYDPKNPLSAPVPTEDYADRLKDGLSGLRLAVPANYFWEFDLPGGEDDNQRQGLRPEVADAVRTAIRVLEELGATTNEVTIPGLEEAGGGAEGARLFDPARPNARGEEDTINVERGFFVQEIPVERRERFSESYRNSITRALEASAMSYLRNIQRMQRIQVALESALEGYDAFVLPTTPLIAPPVDEVAAAAASATAEAAAAREAGATLPAPPGSRGPTAAIGRYTSPFNRSGQPALSVPCGFSPEGLPIGLMIVGHRFDERTVLRIGHAYQQATDWHKRRVGL